MKHIILVNPVSGNKKGRKYGVIVQKLLQKHNIEAQILISNYKKHITELVKEYSHESLCRFYSIGGDGTLNEVITGIIGTDSEVVVVPCGTGNDFIKSISAYRSLRKIINLSIDKKSTPTDVMKIDKNSYCINILNAGFDALVAKNVDKFRNIPFLSGKAKYNLSIFYTLIFSKNYIFKIRIDGTPQKNRFTLLAIANGKFYGGGICPCPTANVTDSRLDICLIDNTTRSQKIIFLPKYKKGKHVALKQVQMLAGQNISIVSNHEFPISVDGEVIYRKKITIKILPKAVNIVHI